MQTGVPGFASVYGVASSAASGGGGRYDYEPARRAAGRGNLGDPRLPASRADGFRCGARRVGPDLALLHDAHHRLTPIQAAKLGRSLESYDLFWLEDVTPTENQQASRLVRQHTTTPLAIGGVFNTVWDYQTLISEQLIDYVRSGMHGPTDVSPVGLAAAGHLGLALHNFGIQEYMLHSEQTTAVFGLPVEFTEGGIRPLEEPGLGMHFDENLAAKYEPAYLPTNRLLDGTVRDW